MRIAEMEQVIARVNTTETGLAVGPIRHFNPEKYVLKRCRIVAHVRDPRDQLTSQYFSIAQSHRVPINDRPEQFLESRNRAREQGIDSFVLRHASDYVSYYRTVMALRDRHPYFSVSRYEDMVMSFPQWLLRICEFLGIPPAHPVMLTLMATTNFAVDMDGPSKHVRQVKPGDHKRKLKPSTISALNESMGDIIEAFGYDADDLGISPWSPDMFRALLPYILKGVAPPTGHS